MKKILIRDMKVGTLFTNHKAEYVFEVTLKPDTDEFEFEGETIWNYMREKFVAKQIPDGMESLWCGSVNPYDVKGSSFYEYEEKKV